MATARGRIVILPSDESYIRCVARRCLERDRAFAPQSVPGLPRCPRRRPFTVRISQVFVAEDSCEDPPIGATSNLGAQFVEMISHVHRKRISPRPALCGRDEHF